MAWQIVIFTDEHVVEAVPKIWIINSNLCYWPKDVKRRRIVIDLIQECKIPNKETWDVVKIRCLGNNTVYDNFEEASVAADQACYTSDIDKADENVKSHKRISKKNRKYTEDYEHLSSSSDASNSEVPLPAPRPNSSTFAEASADNRGNPEPKKSFLKENKEGDKGTRERRIPFGNMNRNTRRDNVVAGNADDKETAVEQNNSIDEELYKKVFERLAYLTIMIKNIAADITEIKTTIYDQGCKNMILEKDDIYYNFPLQTIEAIAELESSIADAQNYKDLVQYMAQIGGMNAYDFVKRVLSRIITNKVASQYSFIGFKGKEVFGKLIICKALIEAAKKVPGLNKVSEIEIEKKIKDWLRHAKERDEKDKTKTTAAV